MYCEECGKEIQSEWNVCPSCGRKINENIQKQISIAPLAEKRKKSIFAQWWFYTIIILLIIILMGIGKGGVQEAEFGKPIIVDDVAYISFNYGTFFDGAVYPLYATDENFGIKYGGDGVMYGIYGVVENLSSRRFDVNEIYEVKLIFDDKYESNTYIWLENEEQTQFLGYDLSDQIYLSPDAIINPKDKYHCVVMGKVGNAVYRDAKEVTVELKILKDVEDMESYVTYRMPLIITEE